MFGVPSPQLITTVCVSPVPESVKEPLTVVELFSLIDPGEPTRSPLLGRRC